jgi:predicted ABC-type ATPase
MWIIAGPNGAGKSTLKAPFLQETGTETVVQLNADEETLQLRARHPSAALDELNLRAAQSVDAQVVLCIKERRGFLVETVLSSGKYRDDVEAARAAGFRIGLIYVSLHPPELSPQRVSERAQKGGHDVVPAKAIDRYHRSHRELIWFARQADILLVYDNSAPDGAPVQLASKINGALHFTPGINPAVDAALRAAFPEIDPPT